MSTSVARDLVILACAISAGIHGALAPEHFGGSAGGGAAFAAAAVALALLALALTWRRSRFFAACAALAFAGLIASYALTVTVGLPLVHPDAEPVEAIALVTKAVEAVGLLAASTQLHSKGLSDDSHSVTAPDPDLPDRARRVLQRVRGAGGVGRQRARAR